MFSWMYKLVGKAASNKIELNEGVPMEGKPWFKSRTVWIAIVGVILGAIQPLSTAFGHPIAVPDWVLQVLAGMGLYTLRAGNQPIV